MHQVSHCPVCNKTKLQVLTKHIYRKPENFQPNHSDAISTRKWILFNRILENKTEHQVQITLCKSCGFLFSNPRMDEKDISNKYQTIDELGSVKKRLKENPPTKLEPRAQRIKRLITKFIPKSPDHRLSILDYGGAAGYNLKPFTKDFDCNVLDFEKWDLPESVKYLGQDLTALNENQKFDIILLLHTLEHAIKPTTLIKQITKHLAPNGIFYIEVPLGCFREWQFLPEPITHLNFFSEQSLANCLKEAGLDVIHFSTKYQWVTHQKLWCINIIGKKSDTKSKITPLSTARQMKHFRYFLPFLLNPNSYFKLLKRIFQK